MLQTATGKLVAEGAQKEVGVGCGHDGAMAPNLVLLHGFTNTGASWDQVVAALPERYRPLAPDIRGHGTASDARPVSLTAVVGDVGAVLTRAVWSSWGTRWAAGSRCTWRWRCRSASGGWW